MKAADLYESRGAVCPLAEVATATGAPEPQWELDGPQWAARDRRTARWDAQPASVAGRGGAQRVPPGGRDRRRGNRISEIPVCAGMSFPPEKGLRHSLMAQIGRRALTWPCFVPHITPNVENH